MASLPTTGQGETLASKVVAIPLELVQPHPKLAFRFRYDVNALAESIKEAADESIPNGQINPGRVVRTEGEEGYYVYVGIRRFLALRTLQERTKDARFGTFNAYVDEGLSALQMFLKAKAENEDEKGERQPVSLLELVSGIRKIRDTFDRSRANPSVKRLLEIADRMEDERLKKLNVAERAVGSGFTASQLEGLARLQGGDAELYTTAATMAAFKVADAEAASQKRDAAFHLTWFRRDFPEIKPESKPAPVGEPAAAEESKPEVHQKKILVAPCPHCGGGNMLRLEGQVEATHISPDPDGKALTMVADALCRAKMACSHCGGDFFVLARHLDGEKYALSVSTSDEFRDPKSKTSALDLRFDRGADAWQRIEGKEIAGLLVLVPKSRKA